MITRPLFFLTPSGLAAYIRIVSSDTEQTQADHSKPEERRTFHYRLLPSKAKALAAYAKANRMIRGGAIEKAIDLLVGSVENESTSLRRRKPR